MNPFRVTLQPAYVLHHRPYRDTSALVEAFTLDYGRVALVARGAKTSRLQGLLQPFRPLLISWSGKTDLVTLTACESAEPAWAILGRTLVSGFYVNELLMRLLHRHDSHPRLFELYADTLDKLQNPEQEQHTLRIFEKHLLQEIGYALVLDHDVDTGQSIEADKLYSYQLEKGPVAYNELHPQGIALHGESLLSLASEVFRDTVSLREAKYLMRSALGLYLGDKPLHSRKLLTDFQRASLSQASDEAEKVI